jgi:hypothetical protein
MTDYTTTAQTEKLIARVEFLAGKSNLPGEPGFVLHNLLTRVQELTAQWRPLGIGEPTAHLREAGMEIWRFAGEVYALADRYCTEIRSIVDDAGVEDRGLAGTAGELLSAIRTGEGFLHTAFSGGSPSVIPTQYFDDIEAHIERAWRLTFAIDAVLVDLLGALKTARAQGASGAAENADEAVAAEERSVPRPPKSSSSRKRPCAKQSGRKRERGDSGNARGGNERRPAQRKLNQYVLDPLTGVVSTVRPGQEIAKGSRVVEQPAGNPKPSIAAFFDASLLPSGSSVVARWGFGVPELDQQLVARAGRLAKLAGYGDQARSTMFDQIARSANPTAALEAFILELGGPDAITAAPGTLTTSATRETLPEVIARSVNTGNEKLVEMGENLPRTLTADTRLAGLLGDLPGMIESLEADGNGAVLRVRSMRFDEKPVICEKLREAGGRNVDVKNTRVEKDGRSVKAYVVSARFNISPVEIAAARTGRKAEVSYRVNADGNVEATYQVDLYGTQVSTPSIPCEPSWDSVTALVQELVRSGDTHAVELVEKTAIGLEHPFEGIAATIGPVRNLEDARKAVGALSVDDLLGDGYAERIADASREIRATDGRRIPVEYRGGVAVLSEFSFHPTDLRVGMLPEIVPGADGETPTRIRRVRFETKKGSNRPRVTVEEIDVSELNERRDSYLEGKDPKAALLTEVRENFIAEATRSMAATLVNPPESLTTARNPEAVAKSRVISKHLDPYEARGGDLVHLVEVLALSQGDEAWSRWCRENVKAFRDDARERRRQKQDAAVDFFDAVGVEPHARGFLLSAGAALLSNRLGRDVSTEEFVEIAREARVTKEHAYTAVDRGRALAAYLKRTN